MKGLVFLAYAVAIASQASQQVGKLGSYLFSSTRGYDCITNKHRKHKRGRPKR